MEISKIVITPTKKYLHTPVKAFATVILDRDIAINGIKIIDRPNKKTEIIFPEFTHLDGSKYGFVVPLRADVREWLCSAVLEEYNKSGSDFRFIK